MSIEAELNASVSKSNGVFFLNHFSFPDFFLIVIFIQMHDGALAFLSVTRVCACAQTYSYELPCRQAEKRRFAYECTNDCRIEGTGWWRKGGQSGGYM